MASMIGGSKRSVFLSVTVPLDVDVWLTFTGVMA